MKKRYLLILTIGAFAIGVIQITINRANVQSRVQAIVAKDEMGQDVTADLAALQKLVSLHMQTSTTIMLKGSYDRAVVTAKSSADSNTDGDVYARAQAACSKRSDSITQAKCVSNYVATNSTPGTNPQPIVMPQPSAFTKTFNSPSWTFDGAGISFLIGIAALAAAAYLALL